MLIFLALAAGLIALRAQNFSLTSYKIAGGGGASTNGAYSVSATIGQPDASGQMTGGNYSVTGGFWSFLAVHTPGAPFLSIDLLGPNSVLISWPAPSTGFVLQQNSDLTTTNWVNVGTAPTVINGTNTVTVSPPLGNWFYRLINP